MKMLNMIDELAREAIAIEVDCLALTHGAPYYVRFDNGPECVAHAVSDCLGSPPAQHDPACRYLMPSPATTESERPRLTVTASAP